MDRILEVCKVVFPIILGSVVVAEIVKLVAEVINNRYNKKIDYALDCVKETNRKIKELIICIKGCSYTSLQDGSLDDCLYELKSCLDVSGYTRKYDYNSDGHAWKDIERMCKSKSEEEFVANKELLLMDLVLIQQFHKDNIKKDIQGKKLNVPFLMFSSAIIIFHAICYFVAFELSDFLLYACEILILLSTILYLPGLFLDSTFEAGYYNKHTRKRENLSKVSKRKVADTVLAIVSFVMLVIMGICSVLLLQLDNLPMEDAYAVSDVVSAEGFGKSFILSLQENRIFIFWFFSVMYIVFGLFNILCIWIQKVDKFFYTETVRKLRIEKNELYVQEIKELIDDAKKRMVQNDKVKYTLVCDKMLVLAYVKLSDLKEYFITEKGKRISSMESREDVEREMRFCENEDKINEVLKLFKKIGKVKISLKRMEKKELKKKMNQSFVKKTEKKVRVISGRLEEISKKIDGIDLYYN